MVKMRLLRRQAERGNVEAMTCLAADYIDLQNFEESTRWFRKAAELGFPDAQVMLGSAYEQGKGVEKESAEAVRWYRRAAEQGDTTAQNIIGGMYLTGDGVEKDIPTGLDWYRKAAAKGDIAAKIMLGGIYANSEFVPNDTAEAVVWYSSAFQANSLTRPLAEKYAKELRWFLSVAEIGDADVLLNVANLYNCENGGLPQDSTEAMRWYCLAAERGNEEALCFIGKMYETGEGVAQDFSEAMRWYQLAAERGNAGAMFNIGIMYTRSQGVSIDPRELYFWFSLCSTCSLPESQANHVKKALQVLHTKLLPESVTEVQERARRWIEAHPKIHFREKQAPSRTDVRQSEPETAVKDEVLRSVTPHVLAVTMLQLAMERNSQWRQVNSDATSEADAKFPMACEAYQLSIFTNLLTQRFGHQISSIFDASLNAVMDVDGGIGLYPRFKNAIARAHQLGPAEIGPDEPKLRMDWQVAQQLLSIVAEPEESKRNLLPPLAESLSYARIWAESTYPGVMAKIEFDPLSIAMVQREGAYRGMTNRWRQAPGCFERQLQRMEGNSLFPETCRNPSDEDIKHATEKDDADAKQIDLDIKQLFDEFRGLGESKSIEGSILIDLLQHRVEPLMERAAEIGVPSALQHIPKLQNFMISMLEMLRSSSGNDELSVEPLRKVWRRKTNVFITQAWRDDTPIAKADRVLALLCEDVSTINEVLELYGELDPELIPKMAEIARLHFQMAELDGFNLPGAKEKMDLFSRS
jgi:TPR repeat protein